MSTEPKKEEPAPEKKPADKPEPHPSPLDKPRTPIRQYPDLGLGTGNEV